MTKVNILNLTILTNRSFFWLFSVTVFLSDRFYIDPDTRGRRGDKCRMLTGYGLQSRQKGRQNYPDSGVQRVAEKRGFSYTAVSYTHLTLPTTPYV